jgi:hypothetical protein
MPFDKKPNFITACIGFKFVCVCVCVCVCVREREREKGTFFR